MAEYFIGSLLSEDGGLLGSALGSALEGVEGGVLEGVLGGEDGGVLESVMGGEMEEECVQEDPLLGIETNVESNFDINIDFNRRPNSGSRPPSHVQLFNQLTQSLTRPPTTTAQPSVAAPSPSQAWAQPHTVTTASAAVTNPPMYIPQVGSSNQPVAQAWVKPQSGVAGSSTAPAQAWVKPPPGTKIVTVTTTTTTPANAQFTQQSSIPGQTATTSSRPVQATTTASRPAQSPVTSFNKHVNNSFTMAKVASTPAQTGTKPPPKVATAYAIRPTANSPRHVKNLPVAKAWVKQAPTTNPTTARASAMTKPAQAWVKPTANSPRHVKNLPVAKAWVKQAPTTNPTTARASARTKPAQAWVKPQPGYTTAKKVTTTDNYVPARKKKVFVDC